jgi:hypothetical protein
MIGHALRLEIERRAIDARVVNPLLVRAEHGAIGAAHLTHYLHGLRSLLGHTPLHMELARARAMAEGDDALAAHLSHKASEEIGHDAWAEADLARVAPPRESTANIPRSMRRFTAWIGEIIEEDPRLYLAYMLFAEYVTVLLAPAWLEMLETRCGVPRTSMTAIDKHVTLDRDHVEEALDVIDTLVADPTRLPRMRRVVQQAFELYGTFCSEVVDLGDRDLLEARSHAPAA